MRKLDVVLASASPRRRELLEAAGWRVAVRPTAVDETRRQGEEAEEYVLRLARAKAHAAAAATDEVGEVILGADTIVAVDGAVLGKPQDDAETQAMLRRLAGREHEVWTGVCLICGNREQARAERTRVWFAGLNEDEIAAYIASGESQDKAGAYAIQGQAARFIPRIEGSYANVVGLPVAAVWEMWKAIEQFIR